MEHLFWVSASIRVIIRYWGREGGEQLGEGGQSVGEGGGVSLSLVGASPLACTLYTLQYTYTVREKNRENVDLLF